MTPTPKDETADVLRIDDAIAGLNIQALASVIHDARWDQGSAASSWVPYESETGSGKVYAMRIANSVQMHLLAALSDRAAEREGEAQWTDENLLRLIADDHQRLAPNGYHSADTLRAIAGSLSTLRTNRDALSRRLEAVEGERDALREAIEAEDDYYAASRAHACVLPRLEEGTRMVLRAAEVRRAAARAALATTGGAK